MSYTGHGRNRPFSNHRSRPGGRRFGGPQRSTVSQSRYINQGVTPAIADVQVITNSFADFAFDPRLTANIVRRGYTTPTPIQDQAIPHILAGKDVVGLANTGTGKTAAFLLPLIHRLLQDDTQGVLVLVPTRELAVQIADELKMFIEGLDMSMALCIGGANIRAQIDRVKNNPHFLIATPGRVKDLLQRHVINTDMFTNVVLDEVDRMLDIGFINDIRFIISCLPDQRHSYFFSATMTREVETIMRSFVQDPVQISVKTVATSTHIDQDVVRVNPGENKSDVLVNLLIQQEFSKVIVFGRTKHGINKLERILSERGLRVSAIHGNKSQAARQRALQLFKRGSTQALLATDIAARGIDIDDVTHVINFDEPQSYEDYIHRIGRTGRAGKGGKALTFIG